MNETNFHYVVRHIAHEKQLQGLCLPSLDYWQVQADMAVALTLFTAIPDVGPCVFHPSPWP